MIFKKQLKCPNCRHPYFRSFAAHLDKSNPYIVCEKCNEELAFDLKSPISMALYLIFILVFLVCAFYGFFSLLDKYESQVILTVYYVIILGLLVAIDKVLTNSFKTLRLKSDKNFSKKAIFLFIFITVGGWIVYEVNQYFIFKKEAEYLKREEVKRNQRIKEYLKRKEEYLKSKEKNKK